MSNFPVLHRFVWRLLNLQLYIFALSSVLNWLCGCMHKQIVEWSPDDRIQSMFLRQSYCDEAELWHYKTLCSLSNLIMDKIDVKSPACASWRVPLDFKMKLIQTRQTTDSLIRQKNHHHYVPSVVNRSAVMDLHRSRSCATLMQSLYDMFVHSLMLSVHTVLGLPRPLLPLEAKNR